MKRFKIHYAIFIIIGLFCLVVLYVPKACCKTKPLPERDMSVRPLTGDNIISGGRALEIAHSTIKGYEHYDKTGKIVVELKGDRYYLTFPHGIAKVPGRLMPDYAMQVCIDAKSGKVLEIKAVS
jgi:hypothetical protein